MYKMLFFRLMAFTQDRDRNTFRVSFSALGRNLQACDLVGSYALMLSA